MTRNIDQDTETKTKILLVDDLDGNLLALDGLLKRDDVITFKAKSGAEALELMIIHEFALALIDVRMPGISGFELAELMRGANRTKNIPIIFVTATAPDKGFLFKGYESGAVDFLFKPLDSHVVKSKVNIFIELYQQKKELKNTQQKLEQAVLIRDEFMSIVSHELKTPLTSLMLNSQMRMRKINKGESSAFTIEKLAKMFEGDEKQLERINRLIDDMLDVSRISSGKLSMKLEEFDLSELILDLLERMSEQFVAAECEVKVDVCPSAKGNWDRFRIEQVIVNLLTNAIRYGEGKPILVQLTRSPGAVRIVVRDQGRGIAFADQERIFQRFERAVTVAEISGLGLGLYIVKQILEAHHGFIRVESQPGKGAAFIVDLPLIPLQLNS